MIKELCENCRHWARGSSPYVGHRHSNARWGWCELIRIDRNTRPYPDATAFPEQAYERADELRDKQLATRDDFGCVLFEPRDDGSMLEPKAGGTDAA